MIEINFKKTLSHDLPVPSFETAGSSGMDIRANLTQQKVLGSGERALIPTGFSVQIPLGYEIQVRPRSGLALKHGIAILNGPGTIDSDYRGEIGIILINLGNEPFAINHGDRIAQLVVQQVIQPEIRLVSQLEESSRGTGGFGSTGI